jgi:hypothetical protein
MIKGCIHEYGVLTTQEVLHRFHEDFFLGLPKVLPVVPLMVCPIKAALAQLKVAVVEVHKDDHGLLLLATLALS